MPVQDHPYHATSNIPVIRLELPPWWSSPNRGETQPEGDSNIRYHPLILIVVMTTDHTSNQFYNMSSLHIIIMDTNNFIFNGFPFALSALMLNLSGIIIITASSMGEYDGNRKIKTSSVDSKQQIFCFTKNFLPGPLWGYYAINPSFIILLDGKARFLELSSKSESEEKEANKTSKKADKVKTGRMQGDKSQSGRVWLHPQPWPGRRGENPLSAGYLG